ncbi:MFS transporter [Cupriavidus sp. AcVe19-1a]|uniref:MFS transporter n=1 Tax=Cupriavidus sp. AcVe19-1a TaxID=2821359 RepID=UPI001AE3CFE0|nr:MFS transporter [Cupriavidus sp. AcVe19-1a]MBP0628288.1 MFS transporter [Cupriavidus sp. AcVe19-1a]
MRALIFCSVQFLLAVTWTLYVAFLPQLATQAGIPRAHVAWILVMDQVIFVAMDLALGIAADRVANGMRRLGGWILALSVVSALAFVLLPSASSPVLLLALTALWAATSSALRAPPMVIIARRLQGSASSFLVLASLLGIGLAGAVAPVLTARLREASPLIPFAAASAALVLAVAALRWVELPPASQRADAAPTASAGPRRLWLLFAAVWLLALGFQVHTAINSGPAYLRFVASAELVRVMPAFWIGFALCVLLPETPWLRRFPACVLLLAASVLGTLALSGFIGAASLQAVLAAQCLAGGMWGIMFGAAANAALDAGHVGREGRLAGLVFAVLAVAAFLRIAMVASGAARGAMLASLMPWVPALAWSAGALLLAFFVTANLPYLAARTRNLRQQARSG